MFPDVRDRESHGRTGQILFGGGQYYLPDRFAYKVHVHTTLFEILSGPFLRIFPWGGGGAFFEKGPFCEMIYSWGISIENV